MQPNSSLFGCIYFSDSFPVPRLPLGRSFSYLYNPIRKVAEKEDESEGGVEGKDGQRYIGGWGPMSVGS